MATILGAGLEVDLGTGSVIHVVKPGAVTSVNGMDGDVVLPYATPQPSYDRKASEIAAVAKSYYDARFLSDGETFRFAYTTKTVRQTYGGDVSFRTDKFRNGYIDCSALAGLILRGLKYSESPYGLADAEGVEKGEEVPDYDPDDAICNPNMTWAINPRDYWCGGNYKDDPDSVDSDDEEDDGTTSQIPAQGRPVSAANLAQLLVTMGDPVPIKGGFSAIQEGDFLFWATRKEDGSYNRPERYLRISHVAVVTEVDSDGKHMFVDSFSSEAPLRRECLETGVPKAEYLVLAVRLKHGRAWERLRIVYNPQNATVAANEYQRLTCIAFGDQVRYRWQYSADGGTTWNNSTLPKTASVSLKAASSYNGRLYRCVCTDTHGRSLNSQAATLTVT